MDNKPAQGTPPRQPDYRIAEDFIVRYANNTFFESSIYDLKIVFGQSDQKAGPNVVNQHTSITLPWPQVKVALYFLDSQLAAYEALYGRIRIDPGIIPAVPDQPPRDVPGAPQAVAEKAWAAVHEAYERFSRENPESVEPSQKTRTK